MILSFGAATEGTAAAVAMGLPSLVALVGYAIAALPSQRYGAGLRMALLIGWVAHAVSIAVDIAGLGATVPGARFGFAPALSVTLWMVLGVYIFESRFVPLPGARLRLALIGLLVIVLAWLFPGQLHPHWAERWVPLHWLLGIASYGLFGAAVLHAAMLSRAEHQLRNAAAASSGMPLLRLERLTYRFVAAGFVTLSASLILGAWFADPWRWDHKTVFSILGWIVFAGLLAGRHAFGWRGPVATRWLYGGAALLLLSYVGSRFVLEVLLHRVPAA